MTSSAPALRRKIRNKNRLYLALRCQQDQERRVYIFTPGLRDQIASVRNEIVELQAKLRKGGELQHA